MGFFALAIGGLGFILIGSLEALASSAPNSSLKHVSIQTSSDSKTSQSSSSSSLSYVFVLIFSILFVLDSIFSFADAVSSRDQVGSALQLPTLAIASLFFLYAVAGLLANSANFPSMLVDSIALFAFAEEFLLFYLQRKDVSGIENRYFDLLLVPIAICVVSTILVLKSPDSNFPKFGRAVGLVLQGMWFVQMAFSFHTSAIAHGCSLHSKSRGNYTLKCKGHPEYHRARAIATLQFNCHLALLVVAIASLYSVIARRNGVADYAAPYRPIAAEMRAFENPSQFTLDSDEDDSEIKEEDSAPKHKAGLVELGLNGHHVSHQ